MAVTPIAVSQSLASVLNAAGDRSDVDFNYLLQTAMRESSLDPDAKAATSSATGLFQFLDTTWLTVMKSEGPRLGYQRYADAIVRNSDGEYTIKDPKLRAEVLKLRENPEVAADMAAAFTKNNGDYLQAKFGRMPSPGELYIAHFLGAQGAAKMFTAGLADPDQVASKLFPREAAANRAIFYDHDRARTIREVYKALVAQHGAPAALDPGYAVQQLLAQQGTGTAASQAPVPLAPLPTRPVPLALLPQAPVMLVPLPGHAGTSNAVAPVPLAPLHPAISVPQAAPRPPLDPQSAALLALEQPMPLSTVPQVVAVPATPAAPGAIVREGNSRQIFTNLAEAPEIPSRIGPGGVSFSNLFTSEADGTTAAEPSQAGQGAFFSQLYGQK